MAHFFSVRNRSIEYHKSLQWDSPINIVHMFKIGIYYTQNTYEVFFSQNPFCRHSPFFPMFLLCSVLQCTEQRCLPHPATFSGLCSLPLFSQYTLLKYWHCFSYTEILVFYILPNPKCPWITEGVFSVLCVRQLWKVWFKQWFTSSVAQPSQYSDGA